MATYVKMLLNLNLQIGGSTACRRVKKVESAAWTIVGPTIKSAYINQHAIKKAIKRNYEVIILISACRRLTTFWFCRS